MRLAVGEVEAIFSRAIDPSPRCGAASSAQSQRSSDLPTRRTMDTNRSNEAGIALAETSKLAQAGSTRLQPAMPTASDLSARAQSLQLLKKKLGASATRRSRGSADAVLPPPPPPLPERSMDSDEPETVVPLERLTALDRHNGHENPATHQDGEETLESAEIPIAVLKQQQALVLAEKRGGKRPSSGVSRPASSSSSGDAEGTETPLHHPHGAARVLSKTVIKWSCLTCQRECIPIREESRCLW